MEMFNPSHPGRILRPHTGDATTVSAPARHLGMARANLPMLLNGRLGASAMTAVKLSEAFPNTDPSFWPGLRKRKKIAPLHKASSLKASPTKAAAVRVAAVSKKAA
jgi:plasmid maintenance system antidote protein VapI